MPEIITTTVTRVEVITLGVQGPPGAPGLSEDEVDYARRSDSLPSLYDNSGLASWSGTTVQVYGDVVELPGTATIFLYCSSGGTTGVTEPTPTASGEIITDGTASWIGIIYDDTVIYSAKADPGTIDSDPAWKLKRTILKPDDDLKEKWANGNSTTDKVWDNRLGLIYT